MKGGKAVYTFLQINIHEVQRNVNCASRVKRGCGENSPPQKGTGVWTFVNRPRGQESWIKLLARTKPESTGPSFEAFEEGWSRRSSECIATLESARPERSDAPSGSRLTCPAAR